MDRDLGRKNPLGGHCSLDPEDYVIAGTLSVIPKAMIQAYLGYLPCLQDLDGFYRPADKWVTYCEKSHFLERQPISISICRTMLPPPPCAGPINRV